jgi:hypothetical protein
MTTLQRRHYFTQLWPRACEVQGWNPRDESRRHEITSIVTGKISTSGLNQLEITRLFNYLKLLASPLSVDHAIPVANPDVEEEEHERRRLLFAIRQFGVNEFYIQKCAEHKCRARGIRQWIELPVPELEKLKWTIKARVKARYTTKKVS